MTFVLSKPVTKKCWLQHNLFMAIWGLLAGPIDPGNKKTAFYSLLKRRIAIIQNIQTFKLFVVMKNIIKTASKVLTKSLTIKIPSLLFLKYVSFTVLVIKTVKEILRNSLPSLNIFQTICIILYFICRSSTKMIWILDWNLP